MNNTRFFKRFFVLGLSLFLLPGCNSSNNSKGDNQNIDIMLEAERAYVDAMYKQAENIPMSQKYCVNNLAGDTVKIADYATNDKCTNFRAVDVTLNANLKLGKEETYVYHLATKEDFSDEIIYQSKDKSVVVNSLLANTKYYYKASDVNFEKESPISTITTSDGWRGLSSGGATNVRDVGGRLVKGNKRIKQGYIYRGSELNAAPYVDSSGSQHYQTLTNETAFTFRKIMKIGTEIDFRSNGEANGQTSSNLGWSVNYIRKSISGYSGLISNSSGNEYKYVKAIFEEFLKAETDNAVYFHCWGGADRTGTIGFLLGGVLGMNYTDLIIDYELTSFSYNLREHDKVGKYSDFPSLISELKKQTGHEDEANPDVQEMCQSFLTNKVGLSTEQIDSLKTKLLEDK